MTDGQGKVQGSCPAAIVYVSIGLDLEPLTLTDFMPLFAQVATTAQSRPGRVDFRPRRLGRSRLLSAVQEGQELGLGKLLVHLCGVRPDRRAVGAGVCTSPNVFVSVLRASPGKELGYCFLCGAMWGVGGLTWGLMIRYLGVGLGLAIGCGLCSAAGTLVPPIIRERRRSSRNSARHTSAAGPGDRSAAWLVVV